MGSGKREEKKKRKGRMQVEEGIEMRIERERRKHGEVGKERRR
jgi:hypothetical protein